MKQENKELLLKDLCARLQCGVIVQLYRLTTIDRKINRVLTPSLFAKLNLYTDIVKPYLRPMSSMTEEELGNYSKLHDGLNQLDDNSFIEIFDFLHAHHFDYRGLIEKGLALEAPSDMYK